MSKADWVSEYSSGYKGWRCRTCGTWRYDKTPPICDCTEKETEERFQEFCRSTLGPQTKPLFFPTESLYPQVFIEEFNKMAAASVANANRHGWDNVSNFGETTALLHSELSEALEADRKGNPPDSHIPEFSAIEAEWADVIIRLMGAAEVRGLRLAEAVVAKMKYNESRPIKHGKDY